MSTQLHGGVIYFPYINNQQPPPLQNKDSFFCITGLFCLISHLIEIYYQLLLTSQLRRIIIIIVVVKYFISGLIFETCPPRLSFESSLNIFHIKERWQIFLFKEICHFLYIKKVEVHKIT